MSSQRTCPAFEQSAAEILRLLSTTWLLACGPAALPPTLPDGLDAGAPTVRGYDFNGDLQPLDALPHWPVLGLSGWGIRADSDPPLWLLPGKPTEALLEDLARKPLTKRHAGSRIAVTSEAIGRHMWLIADTPLSPGESYTLAVGSWLEVDKRTRGSLPLPLAIELSASGQAGGAALLASLPAAGQAGVPVDVSRVLLAFSGSPTDCDGFSLHAAGNAVPTVAGAVDCQQIHEPGDLCCELALAPPARPATRYVASFSTAVDRHGGPVLGTAIDFQTQSHQTTAPPALTPLACAIDERQPAAGICSLATGHQARLRLRSDQPARAQLHHQDRQRSWLVGSGEATLVWPGLAPDAPHEFALALYGPAGRRSHYRFVVETTEPLAPVAIMEVSADPLGSEPHQEFVELWNHGDTTLDVAGFTLSDARDRQGVSIPPGAQMQPGERVLLVADGFDADSPLDISPPPGTQLLRLGKALAHNGLANAGEPLFLRDAAGRRVSAAPATPKPRAGVCRVRVGAPHGGNPGSFAPDDHFGCTPGR